MKNLLIIQVLLAVLMLSSCNKDLGNYNYVTLDSLLVADLPDTLNLTIGQEIDLDPTVSSQHNQIDISELKFQWDIFDPSIIPASESRFIIGNEKHLIIIPKLMVGKYPAYLKITQQSTGRSWTHRFIVNIEGKFGPYGWFILSDKNKKAHLDYFQDDQNNWNSNGTVYRDINNFWLDENTKSPLVLEGEPKSMEIYLNRDAVATAQKIYLYVNTSNNTYKINQTDGFTVNFLKYNFRNETASGNPSSADSIVAYSSFMSHAIKDNNLYAYYFMVSKYYNVPVNSDANGKIYRISPFICAPMDNSLMYAMFYDMDNRRFMRSNYSSARGGEVGITGENFNSSNTGMDLVWMGHTMAFNGQAVAIMKKNNQYYLLRMTFTTTGSVAFHSLTEITTSLTEITQANHFVVDNKYGYLFYTANDKLYQYDMDAKVLKVAKELNGRKVSMLKVERLISLSPSSPGTINNQTRMDPVLNSLLLGTYDESNPSSSGKVEFLHVQGLMGTLKQTIDPMEGFGKVVDVQYTDRY